MKNPYQDHVILEHAGESLKLCPSVHITGDAQAITSGPRGDSLAKAMSGNRCGRDPFGKPCWHVTPVRARKLAILFSGGFMAINVGENLPWKFAKNGVPMTLPEALRFCRMVGGGE